LLSLTIAHVLITAWAAAASVAVRVEAIGMAAAPPGSHKRTHLDERPLVNRAAVIVCALIAPGPPIWNLIRES
jgi:hypothetical protein